MSESMQETQQQIVEDFALFDDCMDRYRFLIDLGRALPPYPDELRTDDWRVKGCINRAWLHGEARDGPVYYPARHESDIVSGMLALLLKVSSGPTTREHADNTSEERTE